MSKQITVNGFSRQVIDLELYEAILKQEPDCEGFYGRPRRFSIDGKMLRYKYINRSWQLELENEYIEIELHDDGTSEIKIKAHMTDTYEPGDSLVTPEFKEAILFCEDIVANREAIIEFLVQCDMYPYDPAQQPDTRLRYRNRTKLST